MGSPGRGSLRPGHGPRGQPPCRAAARVRPAWRPSGPGGPPVHRRPPQQPEQQPRPTPAVHRGWPHHPAAPAGFSTGTTAPRRCRSTVSEGAGQEFGRPCTAHGRPAPSRVASWPLFLRSRSLISDQEFPVRPLRETLRKSWKCWPIGTRRRLRTSLSRSYSLYFPVHQGKRHLRGQRRVRRRLRPQPSSLPSEHGFWVSGRWRGKLRLLRYFSRAGGPASPHRDAARHWGGR